MTPWVGVRAGVLIQGTVTNKDDVFQTIPDDCAGVVVALGGRPNDVGDTMLRDGTRNVIEARRRAREKEPAPIPPALACF